MQRSLTDTAYGIFALHLFCALPQAALLQAQLLGRDASCAFASVCSRYVATLPRLVRVFAPPTHCGFNRESLCYCHTSLATVTPPGLRRATVHSSEESQGRLCPS